MISTVKSFENAESFLTAAQSNHSGIEKIEDSSRHEREPPFAGNRNKGPELVAEPTDDRPV